MRQVGLVARWRMVAGGRVRRREDEPADAGQAGRIEDPDRPGHVRLERPERVADRIVDPGPCREVDDRVDAIDRRADRRRIGERADDQRRAERHRDRRSVRSTGRRGCGPGHRRSASARARFDPMNPAPPVMRTVRVMPRPPGQTWLTSRSRSGAQRTFWTSVAGSIRSRWSLIRTSIVSISSSSSRRGWRPSPRRPVFRAL